MGKPDSTYNKEIKLARECKREIKCGRCPYHRVENAGRKPKTDKYKTDRKKGN